MNKCKKNNLSKEERSNLITSNIDKVIPIVLEYKRKCELTLDELEASALYGLFLASERFIPELHFQFMTYALWWVKGSIKNDIKTERKAGFTSLGKDVYLSKVKNSNSKEILPYDTIEDFQIAEWEAKEWEKKFNWCTPRQEEILNLTYKQDMESKDIAKKLKVSVQCVKEHQKKALEIVKEKLNI